MVRGRVSGIVVTGAYFDLARKDCVGTAADRRSKVWYTVADGASCPDRST
jgi:glucoamylase